MRAWDGGITVTAYRFDSCVCIYLGLKEDLRALATKYGIESAGHMASRAAASAMLQRRCEYA
jgi:hypothetical protein